MKKLILTGLLAMSALFAFAQEGLTDAISYMPQRANGILIMNAKNYGSVKTWKITIQSRTADTRNNVFVYSTVKETTVENSYYLKIDDVYLDGTFYVTVQGFDTRSAIVTSQGPLAIGPASSWTPTCWWKCVGKTYAYGLDLWVAPNGGSSRVQMTSPQPPEDGQPYYYEWIPAAAWPAFTANVGNLGYFNISSFYPSENPGKIIHLDVAPHDPTLIDASDAPIAAGAVYGVAKYFGPWALYSAQMTSNDLASGEENCGQVFEWARHAVNTGSDLPVQTGTTNTMQVSCNGQSSGQYNPEGPEPDEPGEDMEPCIDLLSELTGETNALVGMGLFGIMSDCMFSVVAPDGGGSTGGTVGGTTGVTWPAAVASVTFDPYDNTGGGRPVVLTEASMFDARGNYIGTPVTLGKGLYHVGLLYKSGKYKRGFFISKRQTTSSLAQSDFITATVFPVPISGNDYSLKLTASAHVKFTYRLIDRNGTTLFEKTYELQKGDELTDAISVARGIPSGILYNQLLFTDGSQNSFQTIK